MTITKCDICKKEIKDSDKSVSARFHWASKQFCIDCGKLITNFLLKNKLISAVEINK